MAGQGSGDGGEEGDESLSGIRFIRSDDPHGARGAARELQGEVGAESGQGRIGGWCLQHGGGNPLLQQAKLGRQVVAHHPSVSFVARGRLPPREQFLPLPFQGGEAFRGHVVGHAFGKKSPLFDSGRLFNIAVLDESPAHVSYFFLAVEALWSAAP